MSSTDQGKVLSIIATIMVGMVIIFAISFTLRGFSKKITAPLRHRKPVDLPEPSLAASSNAIYELESMFVAGYVFLRASVISAGEPRMSAWFMLDSGTTSCLLTHDYAAQSAVRATGSTEISARSVTTVGTARVDGFLVASAQSGQSSMQLSPQTVTLLDDDSVVQSIVGGGRIIKENYGGILGVPFLREFNIVIDYGRQQILASRGPISNLGSLETTVPLQMSDPAYGKPSLIVPVSVNAVPAGYWIFDLGSDSSLITKHTADHLGLNAGPPFQQLSLSDASITSGSVRVHLSLGPASTSKQLLVDIPNAEIQALQNYGGDLATDYFQLLGKIGISIQQSELYVFHK